MVLTKKELEIIDLFRKDLTRRETIRGISTSISKSTYTWTFNTVKKLIKLNILSTEIKGKSTICSINLDSPKAIYYLALLDHLEADPKELEGLPISYYTLLKDSQKTYIIVEEDKKQVKKYHPFTKKEFIQLLLEKNDNIAKKLYKNHHILFGAENYYLIIREAMSNVFKG